MHPSPRVKFERTRSQIQNVSHVIRFGSRHVIELEGDGTFSRDKRHTDQKMTAAHLAAAKPKSQRPKNKGKSKKDLLLLPKTSQPWPINSSYPMWPA